MILEFVTVKRPSHGLDRIQSQLLTLLLMVRSSLTVEVGSLLSHYIQGLYMVVSGIC